MFICKGFDMYALDVHCIKFRVCDRCTSYYFRHHDKHSPSAPHTNEANESSSAAPVVFSSITELSAINEEKSKNKVLLHLSDNQKSKSAHHLRSMCCFICVS